MSKRRLLIDLPVRNEWANIELLRTAILNCFAAVFSNMEGCRTISIVISELLENAIKYGDWSNSDADTLRLAVEGEEQTIEVSVEHPIAPDGPQLKTLLETLDWLNTFSSPADAYRARLSELADSPPEAGVSRLGLARIAYEGNCTLTAHLQNKTLRLVGIIKG